MFKGMSMFKGIIVVFILTSVHVAQSATPQTQSFLKKIVTESERIGLTPDEYLLATHSFIRQYDKNENNNDFIIKPLDSFPIYHDAIVYIQNGEELPKPIEKELLKLINSQEAKYASGLGINVLHLTAFRKSLARSNYFLEERTGGGAEAIYAYSKKEAGERITIRCRDFCRGGPGSGTYTHLTLRIQYTAEKVNIPYYTQFRVDFVDENTDETIKSEFWVISPTYAWKDGEAPCDCNSDW